MTHSEVSASSGPAARRKATRDPSGATVMFRGAPRVKRWVRACWRGKESVIARQRRSVSERAVPGGLRGRGTLREQSFHEHDVEPLAELPSDLPLGADDLEPAGGVQRDGCIVAPDDPGHAGVEPMGGGDGRAAPASSARPTPCPWWSRCT